MPLKQYKPTTNGRRKSSVLSFEEVTRSRPEKSLVSRSKNTGGRNVNGRITVRHIGGGSKKVWRMVDFNQADKKDIPGTVKTIEYDPNRNVFIALVAYQDGEKRYMLVPDGMKVGMVVLTAPKAPVKNGNRLQLKNIPSGFSVYNIEMTLGKGGQMVRSAGTAATVLGTEGKHVQVRLPSGEVRKIFGECYATIGRLGNEEIQNVRLGKAGRMRLMGRRPEVRGKVMNPVDHPHGGGEGRNSIGRKHPCTPWGKPALGVKTRRNKRTASMIISRRKKRA